MNIVLLGSPASGKGTQADLLCQKFGLFHLSTGNVARGLAEKDERIKEIVNSGKLIPEEEMTMYVIDFLSKERSDLKDILFEGFPRFISQYEALASFLTTKGDDIDVVISLEVSEKVAIDRVSERRVCSGCGENYNLLTKPSREEGKCDKCGGKLIQRADDNPRAVRVRLRYYRDNTKALIDYLDVKGKLTKVDGERAIKEIHQELVQIVEKIQKS